LPNRFLLLIALLVSSAAYGQTDAEKINTALREGQAFLFRFKPQESLEKYNEAADLARKKPDVYQFAVALLGAGQSQWYMGRFKGAIDTLDLSIRCLRNATAPHHPGWELTFALRIISNIYDESGNYEKAFESVREALELTETIHDQQNALLSLLQLANLYRNTGDYTTAMVYYQKAEKFDPEETSYPYRELYLQKGKLFMAQALYDSALYCYRRALPGHPFPINVRMRIGQCYALQHKYDKAYPYLVDVYKTSKDLVILVPGMISLAGVYLAKNLADSALLVATSAFSLASYQGARQNKRDASQLLAEIYEKKNDGGNALLYYRQYVSLKDSVLSEQFKGHLYAFKQKTAEETRTAQLRLLKGGMLVLAVIAGLVILVLVLRHNNEKIRLMQRSADLEMQALRAQINPHFIFNCLSAINHFILNRDADKASDYLTRFARLIRLVLINSEKNMISLEEEMDMLKLYLTMEQLRFKDAFDYHIRYEKEMQPSMISVPSFILQPFCENAIWHGLLHKEGKGELVIDLSMKGQHMVCVITDNGIGRTKAAEIKTRSVDKQTSFGLKLTTERLALFNNSKNAGSFRIEDVTDNEGNISGTRVIIEIRNNRAHD
jgi:tetratricopeptide (TPR) repeat protein